jgi:hypothetical protein
MAQALEKARDVAGALATTRATSAGAKNIVVDITEDVKLVPLSANKDLFIEASVHAAAVGSAG